MHKDMNALHELQQIDSAIAELEADLAGLDDGSELRERIAEAEAKLGLERGTHNENYAAQKKKEADLEKTDGKLKGLMGKAYGGVVANPKELETLEQEIGALGRTKDRLENELLELYDVVDEQKRASESQEALLGELGAQLQETVGTYESDRERITQQVATLRDDRAKVQESVEPESLRKYEHIRERWGNLAVVAIEDKVCTGCRVSLPVVLIRRLSEGSALEQCENCLRLLWIRGD